MGTGVIKFYGKIALERVTPKRKEDSEVLPSEGSMKTHSIQILVAYTG